MSTILYIVHLWVKLSLIITDIRIAERVLRILRELTHFVCFYHHGLATLSNRRWLPLPGILTLWNYNFIQEGKTMSYYPGGGGGGGVTSIGGRTRCSRKKKTRKKGIQIRGGRGTRKGCQKREKWEKRVYPNRYDQNSSHAIKRGKGII